MSELRVEESDDVGDHRQWPLLVRKFFSGGSVTVTLLSLVLAFAVGAVVIAVSDPEVRTAWADLIDSPGGAIAATWDSVASSYGALFRGAIVDPSAVSEAFRGGSVSAMLAPLSETVVATTPLILAGLSVTLAFRAGLFNIGGQGQAMLGATAAGFVGFHFGLPPVVHVVAALVAGLLAGLAWGSIPGALKAWTGAHEVITTIMLNYIAGILLLYLLSLSVFIRPGRTDAISPRVDGDARLPHLLGADLRVHAGILVAVGVAGIVWWLLARTTVGFELRAVSLNERAATTAGISSGRAWIVGMTVAGGLSGLAGAVQLLGTDYALVPGSGASLGFLGISVALLGRATVTGTVLASLLYGALQAGGIRMQAATSTPVDIVVIIQALVVLFVATPQLVRSSFRLPSAGSGLQVMSRGW